MPYPIRPAAAPLVFALVLAAAWSVPAGTVGAEPLESSGVALVPEDAAFFSATLRIREQVDRLVKSNAWAALKKLPSVARALESVEEQRLQPGGPLSILSTFMELPENQQALELLQEMVATDTFVYGEPSCVTFLQLVKKLQQAQNAASILRLASGEASVGGFDIDVLEGIDVPSDDDDDDEEDDDDDDDDEEDDEDEDEDDDDENRAATRAGRRVRALPVRFQAEAGERLSAEELATRLFVKTLADNVGMIVVPDVVWGFQVGKRDVAEFQLKRLEVLVKGLAQMNPALADSLERRTIAGGEVVTFTIKPDAELFRGLVPELEDARGDLEKVFAKLEQLQVVIGLGVIGDRVILSIGDSIDHLEKLARPGSGKKGLVAAQPFAPLQAHAGKPLTGISYLSEPLQKALAPSAADIQQFADLADTVADLADLPDGAAETARRNLAKVAEGYGRRLPVPGPWMSFSFFSEQGYEGYAWDWSRNLPFDGSKRLEILEHVGGAPLAAAALRLKHDPGQLDDFAEWTGMAWSFFRTYLLPKAEPDDREKFDEIDEHLAPLGVKLVGILRTKILPALADGQMAFVIDGKSSTKRPHVSLPAAAEPLPLVEPAIVFGLADPKLFKEGMNDLFELGDDLVNAVRELSPDAMPAEYRVPEPVKQKVEAGAIWTFPLARGGFDERLQPTIGVGDDVAVLSLVPKQAGRVLLEARLDTGSQLTKFEEPLAGAATLDFAGLVDLIQPWAVYLTRYGCVQQRDGAVDPDSELGPDDENEQAKEALVQAKTVFEAIKSLRVAVAETSQQADAMVTHWRNVIRDLPAR